MCIYGEPAQETAKHRAVWLAYKMRNPLEFAGVFQTRQSVLAVSGPKFTI